MLTSEECGERRRWGAVLYNWSCREKRTAISMKKFLCRRGFLLARYFLLEIFKVGLCCDAVYADRIEVYSFCDMRSPFF